MGSTRLEKFCAQSTVSQKGGGSGELPFEEKAQARGGEGPRCHRAHEKDDSFQTTQFFQKIELSPIPIIEVAEESIRRRSTFPRFSLVYVFKTPNTRFMTVSKIWS